MNAPARPTGTHKTLSAIRMHPGRTILGLLALGLVVLVLLWDWNWLRGPIERIVQAQTGREFDIGGDLDVDLGRITTVRMDTVRFGNAEWSKQGDMAASDRVQVQFELFPAIFKREIRLPELRLTRPRVRLEMGPEGTGNWVFGDPPEPDSKPLALGNLWVDGGRLGYLDAKGGTEVDVRLQSRASKQGGAADIGVEGSGRWNGNRFTLRGTGESPLALQDTEQPYRIDLRASAGATHAHARGTLLDPLRFRDFDLKLALSGQDMEDLYPLIGVAIPPTPPYNVDGRLTRVVHGAASSTWRYDGFVGKVGDSDLSGLAHVTTGKRVFLKADLHSRRLDFDDLAGFVGSAPQAGAKEASNAELKALAAQRAADPKVLPDQPYQLDKLQAMDGDIRLRAARINAPSLPLDDMDAHLLLDQGIVRLEPLNFGVAGGDIRSTIRMDASESPIRTRARVSVRRLELGKLMPNVELTQDAVGRIGGDLNIATTGNSIAKMLGNADGDIAVGMGKGEISNLLIELAGIDIFEAVKYLIGKDRKVPIRCAFGDFAVKDGLMSTRSMAFDTTDTIVLGQGTVSLREETLDLTLRPRPKDRSILSLRSPLHIGGTFKDPSFRPDLARLGLRGAIAVALGSIAPPAALLATLELGGGKDSDCGGSYAK